MVKNLSYLTKIWEYKCDKILRVISLLDWRSCKEGSAQLECGSGKIYMVRLGKCWQRKLMRGVCIPHSSHVWPTKHPLFITDANIMYQTSLPSLAYAKIPFAFQSKSMPQFLKKMLPPTLPLTSTHLSNLDQLNLFSSCVLIFCNLNKIIRVRSDYIVIFF